VAESEAVSVRRDPDAESGHESLIQVRAAEGTEGLGRGSRVPAVDRVGGAELMIEARGELRVVVDQDGSGQQGLDTAGVGQRDLGEKRRGDRIQAAGRDTVAGKRRAAKRGGVSAERIVDRRKRREVAPAHRGGRKRKRSGERAVLAQRFAVDKEKG